MSEISKSGTPSLSSLIPEGADNLAGLLAGEDLGAYDACYIRASDNLVCKSTGAAVGAAAKVRGYAAKPTKAGEAVTLHKDVRVRYGANLTPGTDVYLSGTVPGGLADAPSTGDTAPLGFAVDTTRIYLRLSNY